MGIEQIAWLAHHAHEVSGGDQQLDELLLAHQQELLGGFEDYDPVGPPDPERWPHRAHEISEGRWKEWVQHIDDALSFGCDVLLDQGLVVYLVLDAHPRLALFAADEDQGDDEPELTGEGAQALVLALLARLQLPADALGLAAQRLAPKLERVCRRMYNVRLVAPGTGPGPEQALAARQESLLQRFRDCYVPRSPDPERWPHRASEIEDEEWEDWLGAIEDTLDEYNRMMQDLELALVLTLSRRRGPVLALLDMDNEPLRWPAARAFTEGAMRAMEIPRTALEMLIATRAEWLEEACSGMDNVQFED
jgi:truncated hemoglobin YjbI